MAEKAAEMLDAAGVKNIGTYAEASVAGYGIDEVGVARMGTDPKNSVLNAFQQTHDVRPLRDGLAGFTSSACQNRRYIMALTVRSRPPARRAGAGQPKGSLSVSRAVVPSVSA